MTPFESVPLDSSIENFQEVLLQRYIGVGKELVVGLVGVFYLGHPIHIEIFEICS